MTKLSTILLRELKKRACGNIKNTAASLGVSYEILRRTLHEGHIPGDRILQKIARALGLDPAILLVAAHRQLMSRHMRASVLPIAPPTGPWEQKRKWPLSQEQCDYLCREMSAQEIQFIRKYRQLTPDQKAQVVGYIHYMFAEHRVPQPSEPLSSEPAAAQQSPLPDVQPITQTELCYRPSE